MTVDGEVIVASDIDRARCFLVEFTGNSGMISGSWRIYILDDVSSRT